MDNRIFDPTSPFGSDAIYFENALEFRKYGKEIGLCSHRMKDAIDDFLQCSQFIETCKTKELSELYPEWISYVKKCEEYIELYMLRESC